MFEQSLEQLDQKQLDEVIKKHIRFSTGRPNGGRAVLKFKMLAGLNFRGADLSGADFTGSDMRGCYLCGGNYSGAIFSSCNLSGANLERSNLTRADFRGADLTDANMTGADLTKADMRGGAKLISHPKETIPERKTNDENSQKEEKTEIFVAKQKKEPLVREATVDLSYTGKPTKSQEDEKILSLDSGPDETHSYLQREAAVDLSQSGQKNEQVREGLTDLSQAEEVSGGSMREAAIDLSQTAAAQLATREAFVEIIEKDAGQTRTSDLVLKGEEIVGRASSDLDLSPAQEDALRTKLRDHALWIQFGGSKGERMDASGYPLCAIPDLGRYPLTAIKAEKSIFRGLHLLAAQMQSAVFDGSDFRDTNLQEADLRGSSFLDALLRRANLAMAKMGPLSFAGPDGTPHLQRCNFSGADFREANLEGAILKYAILVGANFQGANLRKADLRGADLTNANLDGAILEQARRDEIPIE